MIAVLGATGHLGNTLVRKLLEKNKKVRAIVPIGEDLEPLNGLNVDIFYADLRDVNSLKFAFKGAEIVYHVAGAVKISSGNKKFLYDINVRGTENVIEACKFADVKKLVYASSVHALYEPSEGTIIDERQPFDPKAVSGYYAKTKAMASLKVLSAAKNGLNAVLLCPTGIIGPYDFKISQMAQLVIDFASRRLKTYIDGAYDFVDVRDVAEGFILASGKAKKGDVYVLSGERITIEHFMNLLEKYTGIKKPRMKMPYFLAQVTAPFTPIYYRFSKTKPLFTPYSIKVLRSNSFISSEKARKELGFSHRSIEESILDMVKWLYANGFLPVNLCFS